MPKAREHNIRSSNCTCNLTRISFASPWSTMSIDHPDLREPIEACRCSVSSTIHNAFRNNVSIINLTDRKPYWSDTRDRFALIPCAATVDIMNSSSWMQLSFLVSSFSLMLCHFFISTKAPVASISLQFSTSLHCLISKPLVRIIELSACQANQST